MKSNLIYAEKFVQKNIISDIFVGFTERHFHIHYLSVNKIMKKIFIFEKQNILFNGIEILDGFNTEFMLYNEIKSKGKRLCIKCFDKNIKRCDK